MNARRIDARGMVASITLDVVFVKVIAVVVMVISTFLRTGEVADSAWRVYIGFPVSMSLGP